LPVTRLRVGRLLLLLFLGVLLVIGGAIWLLLTQGHPLQAPTLDSSAWPAWMRQAVSYAPAAPPPEKVAETPADPLAGINAKLAKLLADLQRQQAELDALKKRPAGTTIINPAQQQAAAVKPPAKIPQTTLFVAHEVKDPPPAPGVGMYTLAPGATKLPCIVETAMNSDVEGYFTSKVSANVYDTATGRHLLVPQGSTILGHDQSQHLLYGNTRLPTISLTLAFPDGRSVDLGQAPVTDQQGIAGLTGRVDNHWLRLFGAVFIGGALRGGVQAMHIGLSQAAGAGQVASGIGSVANQAVNPRIGRALDTRPTIAVDAGQLCNVLLTKPLQLPALWQ
jgi:type IV secretory pathway VirB10-like protein